jgi:hypothetical protein
VLSLQPGGGLSASGLPVPTLHHSIHNASNHPSRIPHFTAISSQNIAGGADSPDGAALQPDAPVPQAVGPHPGRRQHAEQEKPSTTAAGVVVLWSFARRRLDGASVGGRAEKVRVVP